MLESLIKPAHTNGTGAVSRETAIIRIPLHRIVDNPYQPRLDYAPESLQDLAAGIVALKEQLPDTLGLQQIPIARLVWLRDEPQPVPIAEYVKGAQFDLFERLGVQLHFGHRRLRAFRLLAETDPDYAAMPIRIAYANELDMWRHAATENARRVGLNPIERARSIQAAMTDFGLAIDAAAEPYGYSRSAAANSVRLLRLPLAIQKAVAAGDISEKHARTLLRLEDAPHLLATTHEMAVNGGWSTRVLDDRITGIIQQSPAIPDAPTEEEYEQYGFKRTRTVAAPWPLDFGPDTPGWENLNADNRFKAKGACAGCQYRVQFHGDAYPRCTLQLCYDAKSRLWRDHQVAQQQAALMAKAKAVYVEPTPAPAEPPAWEGPKNADATMTVADVAALIRQALAERDDCPGLDPLVNGSTWSIWLSNNYGKWPTIDTTRQAIKMVQRKPGQVDAYAWLSAYIDDKGRTWRDLEDNQVYHANSPCFQAFAKAHPTLTKDKAKEALMEALTRLQVGDAEFESIMEEEAAAQSPITSHQSPITSHQSPAPVPSPQSPSSAIPVDKMSGDLGTRDVAWFGGYNAPAKFIDEGLCSAERCECFVLAYNQHPNTSNVRPDADAAPNMCYGCTSSSRMAARKREAEKKSNPDGLTKKQAAKAQAAVERARIEDAFHELGAANLWNNAAFLRAAFSALNYSLNQNLKIDLDGGSVEDLQRAVYLAAAYHACDTYIHDMGDYDVYKGHVDSFLGKLRSAPQPGPGDSQRTGWEHGWNGEDDEEWAKLTSVPFADWPAKCRRPRVILRGLEYATGKETRGALWRWYNELESRGY